MKRGSEILGAEQLDLRLIRRILQFVIEDTKHQVGKKFDPDNPIEAIFELSRTKQLIPPFDKLISRSQLQQKVIRQNDLFEKVKEDWTEEVVEKIIQKLKEWQLIYEIELNKSQYAQPSKIIVQPIGLLVYEKINKETSRESINEQEFKKWIDESHFEHSQYALEAFRRKVWMNVHSSQRLSPFNISLALFLLMYGAVKRDRALRVQVNPTENIHLYKEIISDELTRIGKKVFNIDLMNRSTLLDHIQETDKIKRILDNSKLYVRYKSPAPDGSLQYNLYFDIGSEDVSQPEAQTKLDSILEAIISNARGRNQNAPAAIVSLFQEHIGSISTIVKPVHTKTLFGASPSLPYLIALHERAENILDQIEDGEEQNDDYEE